MLLYGPLPIPARKTRRRLCSKIQLATMESTEGEGACPQGNGRKRRKNEIKGLHAGILSHAAAKHHVNTATSGDATSHQNGTPRKNK